MARNSHEALRERARELFEEHRGEITMPELAGRLRKEGFRANADTLRKWSNRDKWDTPAPVARAAKKVARAAMAVVVEPILVDTSADPVVARASAVDASPTIDAVIARFMALCDEFGAVIQANVRNVALAKPAEFAIMAGAMKTAADAAMVLQEAAMRARGLSMKEIQAIGSGAPIHGDLLPAQSAPHSNLTAAINAFAKKA